MELEQHIKIAVDAIVFGYTENSLNVLLVKQKYGILKNQWALVGGFVQDNETLNNAVNRELQEEAGIKVNYLEQLFTFGDKLDRDPRFRVISVAYFALVNSSKLILKADTDAEDAKWFPIKELPPLAFDHEEILQTAHQRLKNKLTYQPIGFDLLPKEFLFSDLENLYCTILEKEIDRRNFRKKILSFGIIEETEKFSPKKSGRPAKLFKFNKLKYNKLTNEGFLFEINFA
ncbi:MULTISPECIES: NrtR DNA-binding winged helix domain-containing protein [unclassified Arcicella]|uniref:NUDIX hydrolase n=1 Tax=unclassified Arcicella TaxID=2644986 RepID=UPI002862047C|nr:MULTISPECIES: NUDIX domain-containing protein [unclassified Arcicella]MDR6560524.1 8-oxo-dGTP diphosphatase [Arcicella sp. BE51]MDR6809870.1 8-oxo-dGTP diphosphatase [Arcicella sp. BE140]MDR6821219.1 8-oxo-dGTP diphosphatase [Arcicella sp. BE139]